MTNNTTSPARDTAPRVNEFRTVVGLVSAYLGLSLATLVAAFILRDVPAAVNSAVWIRGSIVAATAVLMLFFAIGAYRGSTRALLRLRIESALLLVAIVVILAIPLPFPLWMKIEQGVCGLLLLGVVALVNSPRLRALNAGR
jgi:hypothetical protein